MTSDLLIAADEDDGLSIDGEVLDDSEQLETCDGPSLFTPDGVDQEELLQSLYKDLHRGEQAKAVLAEAEMRRVIEFQQQFEHRTIEGLGQLVCSVPLSVYLYWVAREGPDFWTQRSNLDYFAQRAGGGQGNPGFFAKHERKATVRVAGNLPPSTAATASDHEERPVGAGLNKPAPTASSGVRGRRGRWAA